LVTDDPGEFPDQSNRLKDWNQWIVIENSLLKFLNRTNVLNK
jgi:hypothetical protein